MNTYEYEIFRVVERLGEIMKVSARQIGAEYGLLPVQLEVLHYLASCNRFSDTLMSVVEYLGQTKGTISQTVKTLEQKGFIEKFQDPEDKRTIHLKVTGSGYRLVNEKLPGEQFKLACQKLGAADQEVVERALKRLTTSLIETSEIKTFGICKTCKFNRREASQFYCELLKIPLLKDDVTKICKEHQQMI